MSKTWQEVLEEHQRRTAQIAMGVMDAYAEIGAEGIEEGRYLDQLTGEQRLAILRGQTAEKASEARASAVEENVVEAERYAEEVRELRRSLKPRLFDVADTTLLATVAVYSDEQLAAVFDTAVHTGSQDLAKAVFAEADRRGRGDLVNRYFSEVGPSATDFYQEWRELPDEQALERKIENAPAAVPEPTPYQLMPSARAAT
jgi:hypothetical protein